MNDVTIVKYEDKYKDEIIQFLIDVAIGEFGYTEWENYFKTKSFVMLNPSPISFISSTKSYITFLASNLSHWAVAKESSKSE